MMRVWRGGMAHSHDETGSLRCNTIDAAALTSVTGGKSTGNAAERFKLQKQIEKRSQMFATLRQIADKRHETAKAIIANMR
jgi:hypothetical protein